MRQHWHHVLLVAAVLILALTFCAPAAQAGQVHPVYYPLLHILKHKPKLPPVVKLPPPSGGGAAITGGAVFVGVGIGLVGAAAAWCGLNYPKRDRSRDTYVPSRHDLYPKDDGPPPDTCIWRDPQPVSTVSVRG